MEQMLKKNRHGEKTRFIMINRMYTSLNYWNGSEQGISLLGQIF